MNNMDNQETQKEYIFVPVRSVVAVNGKEQTPDTTDNKPSTKFSKVVEAIKEIGWYD